ncbi:MAG: DUF3347 domain-containing protein [Bacteroidetes bacterium]|nr:DUF3347 domain-containing protein [Bacteroidota bacterium]
MNFKKIVDLLAILLPALIILLGIIRVFVKKTKGVNGLTMLFAILLLLIGLVRFYVPWGGGGSNNSGPKPPPLSVSKHSALFNESIEKVLTSYFSMTEAFAKGDTAAIGQQGNQLKTALDSFKIEELKADTLIYETALQPYSNTKSELVSILSDPSLAEKRSSLNIFSNELFALLSASRYDQARLFWLECTRAFGEDKPGNWISKTEKGTNPYGQEDCTEMKDKIDHIPADTTQKPAAAPTN